MSHRNDRRWLGLAVLTVPVVLTSMDISILHMAVPTITHELAPTPSQTLWILDSYGFLLAGLLIVMGNIGDRIGRRRLLVIGAGVFGAASLVAALAPTPEVLIAGRALMGIGGATLMPSTLSLIRNMFDNPAERTRAIGIWTAGLAGGVALGPIVGGLLLEVFWWGSIFMINVPVVLALMVTVWLLVPEYRHPVARSLDLISVGLSFLMILPIVWAIKTIADELAITADAILAATLGIGAGIAFLIRQRRLSVPLVDIRLFGNPRFCGAVAGGSLAMFALVALMLYNSQYLQLVIGLSPLYAALWTLPVMVAVGTMSVASSVLVRRFGYSVVFGCGAAVATAGMFVFSFTPHEDGLAIAVAGCALVGAGIAPMMTLATDVVVASVSASRSGAASALSETASELGAALGIAVLGSIGGAWYRSTVLAEVPADIPTEAAVAISSSLGAALAVAEHLPSEASTHLSSVAKAAFVDGSSVATLIGAVILAVAAVLCPVLLSRRS